MNESKTLTIIVIFSLILVLLGGLLLWQQGWFKETISDKIEQLSFWKLLPDLIGLKEEKAYLLLFQNNLELRPSGGYLGNFGILKVKNAQIASFEIHDTNIFDGFGQVQTEPPLPLEKYLRITNWQMRDSNWSPDFSVASQQAEYFYHLQGGTEQFDGIIGINAAVLPALLEFTGPVYLNEFAKEFKDEDALYQLEYEVEKGYQERGLEPGERKTIFKALVKQILNQILEKNFWEQTELKDLIFKELDNKNILIFLKDVNQQETIDKLGWDGAVNKNYLNDYLMLVEANLGARKSNAFIERQVEYSVDLTKSRPEATLSIKYSHKNGQKDWFNHDYLAYLRIYLPKQSWLLQAQGVEDETIFLDDLNKTVFGNWINVLAGQEKMISFTYFLPARPAGGPEEIKGENQYRILVQKQIGLENLSFKLILKAPDQKEYVQEVIIENDWEGVIDY